MKFDCYLVDGNFDSLLTAVFLAFERKERPSMLMRIGNGASLIDGISVNVGVERNRSMRVWKYLQRILPDRVLTMISTAYLCDNELVDMSIFKAIIYLVEQGKIADGDFSCKSMADLLWCYRRVSRRACEMCDRFIGRMRCKTSSEFVLNGREEDLLPLVAKRLSAYYSFSQFCIVDADRGYGLFYRNGVVDNYMESHPKLWNSSMWPYLNAV